VVNPILDGEVLEALVLTKTGHKDVYRLNQNHLVCPFCQLRVELSYFFHCLNASFQRHVEIKDQRMDGAQSQIVGLLQNSFTGIHKHPVDYLLPVHIEFGPLLNSDAFKIKLDCLQVDPLVVSNDY
jgi:hypothetical protein